LVQICFVRKISNFGADLKFNMAASVHNVFSLAEILKIFLSETTKPIELLLCRNDHWIKNLIYDHPMNISGTFGSNLFCGFRKKVENVKSP
jgi:hypothetical protein